MRYQQLLIEGGNIFKDASGEPVTRRIAREEIPATLSWLEKITKLPVRSNTIGSTGKVATSGDIDVAVDAELITKEELADKLSGWAKGKGFDPRDYVRKSGVSVHLKTPIKGDPQNGYVQTDFMFYTDPEFAKWMGSYDAESQFKNVDRIILMNSIAKHLGLKMSPDIGLVSRKSGNQITRDPNEVAKILIGPKANSKDLRSVESIMKALRSDSERDEKTADARANFATRGIDLDLIAGA